MSTSNLNKIEFLYLVKYKNFEKSLCQLETKVLFNINLTDNVFFSNKEIDPAISPFLNLSLKIIERADSFTNLFNKVKENKYQYSDFKVEYAILLSDCPSYHSRKDLCKQIGLFIQGYPSFKNPKVVLGITSYKNVWYFGILNKDMGLWRNHKHKPYNYSASLNMNTAKALANIAGQGDFTRKIIDPCCGVGTVLLEGLFAGYDIKGRDINYLVAKHANINLKYFNYPQVVVKGDIKDITNYYDAAVIDMPYGLYYASNDETQLNIIKSAKRIAKRVVFIHASDISAILVDAGFTIKDSCIINKGMKRSSFKRTIWVCEG